MAEKWCHKLLSDGSGSRDFCRIIHGSSMGNMPSKGMARCHRLAISVMVGVLACGEIIWNGVTYERNDI